MEINIFRKDMLISSLIIVIAIFIFGFYLGHKLDDYRVDDATNLLNKGELDTESFNTIEQFYDLSEQDQCGFKKQKISLLAEQLAEMGNTLTIYDQKKLTHKNSYKDLKRRYFISELKFYNLKKKLDNSCSPENDMLLFFYNVQDNEESLRQGYVLDVIGRENKNIKILSFDKDFDEGSIKVLTIFFNITKAPTLIYNNKKIEGFISEGELRSLLNENK